MAKYILLLAFTLYSIHCAFSEMQCWITDPEALEARTPKPHSVGSCPKFIQDGIKKYGVVVDENVLKYLPTTCYNVKIKAGAPISDFVAKGCVPLGGCDVVKQITQRELEARGYWKAVTNITCEECIGANCNELD